MPTPKLWVVPTPIGNLEDITLRAIRILKEVDLILAEDTRTSLLLLKHYQIAKPLLPFHLHNEHHAYRAILQRISSGIQAALISDAGTPAIADPGFLLIRACVNHRIDVECLPGPTAFTPALVQSAFPAERFIFEGFLPPKKGRRKRLEALSLEKRTTILYESPHRLRKLLAEINEILGPNRHIAIAREITKIHAQSLRGNAATIQDHFLHTEPRGEFVIAIAPFDHAESDQTDFHHP